MEKTAKRKQLDMLHGSIWNKLPQFALPAVGANSPIIGLIVNLFIGIALGTNVVIAHAIGQGEREDVQKAVHTSVVISVLGGALVALLGELAAAPLLGILRIGLPAGIQSAVFAVSNIVIQSAINSLGTVVMAASSAAFNIEVFTYDILNSFSQTCTTFVGQNFGAGELRRCRKTLALCLIEGVAALAVAITAILFFGKSLLAVFNNDPEVIATGYIRIMMVMTSHSFSLFYEVMSGYLRGFGISLAPALLTMLGVCGVRIAWIQLVFPLNGSFQTIMTAYPISLCTTALLILIALLWYHPSKRFAAKKGTE